MRQPRIPALAAAALLACTAAAAAAGDPATGREKAKVCRVCHGMDGIGRMPNVPNIAGESELYLVKQLKAFRSGERKDEQMAVVAKPLSDDDIANLAAWYAAIEFTVTAPK